MGKKKLSLRDDSSSKASHKRSLRDDSSSKASDKRTKHSSFPLPPPPPPSPPAASQPLTPVRYEDMPLNHKRKFYIHDDCGSMLKYVELVSWLRTMGSYNGTVFEEIPNLNWIIEGGYPLVEVEVITPQNNSAKFLISKNVLYLFACCVRGVWYQYKGCSFRLDIAVVLKDCSGSYTGKPWENVGPKAMIDAVNLIASLDIQMNGNVKQLVGACEIFYVHLSEAARLYPVESFVCRSLKPSQELQCNSRTYADEEQILLDAKGGRKIRVEDDAYGLVKSDGCVDFDLNLPTPSFMARLVKKYSNLSKVWFVYALTEKKCFPMAPVDVEQWNMRSIKSLRCTLAVLCNVNLERVVAYWKGKCGTHEIVTRDVYSKMEARFHELAAQKQIRIED